VPGGAGEAADPRTARWEHTSGLSCRVHSNSGSGYAVNPHLGPRLHAWEQHRRSNCRHRAVGAAVSSRFEQTAACRQPGRPVGRQPRARALSEPARPAWARQSAAYPKDLVRSSGQA